MTALSENELDRLEALLDSEFLGGEAMLLDEIQGFFCAMLSGPEPIQPAQWLPEVLGPAMESHLDAEDLRELIDLLIRFYNQHAAALAAGENFPLYLYPEEYLDEAAADEAAGAAPEEETPSFDYKMWCEAYLFGTEMSATPWAEAAGQHEERLIELMEPFYLLTGLLKSEAERLEESWMSPAEEARILADRQMNLPFIIQDIYNFWRAMRTPVTERRSEPKVGRNDLCPCGSGKKFKQCCGSPEKLN